MVKVKQRRQDASSKLTLASQGYPPLSITSGLAQHKAAKPQVRLLHPDYTQGGIAYPQSFAIAQRD